MNITFGERTHVFLKDIAPLSSETFTEMYFGGKKILLFDSSPLNFLKWSIIDEGLKVECRKEYMDEVKERVNKLPEITKAIEDVLLDSPSKTELVTNKGFCVLPGTIKVHKPLMYMSLDHTCIDASVRSTHVIQRMYSLIRSNYAALVYIKDTPHLAWTEVGDLLVYLMAAPYHKYLFGGENQVDAWLMIKRFTPDIFGHAINHPPHEGSKNTYIKKVDGGLDGYTTV